MDETLEVLNAIWMLVDVEWNHVNLRGAFLCFFFRKKNRRPIFSPRCLFAVTLGFSVQFQSQCFTRHFGQLQCCFEHICDERHDSETEIFGTKLRAFTGYMGEVVLRCKKSSFCGVYYGLSNRTAL